MKRPVEAKAQSKAPDLTVPGCYLALIVLVLPGLLPAPVLLLPASAANKASQSDLPPPSPVPAPLLPTTRIDRPVKASTAAPKSNAAPKTNAAPTDTRITRPAEFKSLAPVPDVLTPPPPSPVPPPRVVPPGASNVPSGSHSTGNPAGLSTAPPVAPPISPPISSPVSPSRGLLPLSTPAGTAVPPTTGGASGVTDPYPTIGKLEDLTLGQRQPGQNITERLAALETTVFRRTYSEDTLFDRTERLKKTIIGGPDVDPNSAAARDESFGAGNQAQDVMQGLGLIDGPNGAAESAKVEHYLDEIAHRPENLEAATPEQVAQFAIELVNTERRNFGLGPIAPDNNAEKIAREHVQDQAKRSAISHFSEKGDGPDRRYTLAEGTDALTECVASIKTSEVGARQLCRASAAALIKSLISRQDDRDALLSPDATHIGFAAALGAGGERTFGTFEVINRHGVMGPLPFEATLGEKLEVKGVMHSPYIFDRVTLAWEGYNPEGMASASDESEEALPYFPPLDYVAYAARSEQNHDMAINTLKAVGMVAAIGGGMFFPPIALAAPLIAISGSTSEPRPVSDIPVKGGIKLDGAAFSGKIPLSNSNKEGLYYVTIWGTLGKGQKSVPVSRRVILVKTKGDVETEISGERLTPAESSKDQKLADDSDKKSRKSKKDKKKDKDKDKEKSEEKSEAKDKATDADNNKDVKIDSDKEKTDKND
ncbi:MAG: CAP domain-containing protein [Candidatus Obscuribacter sp.]|nr:CAP domain-containing protein [Candidatus Obscuribacter sp.]